MLQRGLLRGERVRLTAVTADDLPSMAVWWADADFLRLYDSSPAFPRAVAQLAMRLVDCVLGKTNFLFGIRPLDSDKLLGLIELDGIIWPHGTSAVSIAIGEQAERGKGYGREAMGLVLDFAFRELNLYRVFLTVFNYNTAAMSMYEKLGFTHEGTHRQHLQRDGQRFDMLLYGLLGHEWLSKGS
jgi:RimJ/RimL family protein N-acetyltransferase